MLTVEQLPHVNAFLNGVAAILLLSGFMAIRAKRKRLHMGLMISAAVTSALFLTFYLIYHFHSPINTFNAPPTITYAYYTLLITHVVLAMANLPMIIATFWLALRGNFEKHPRLARWTLPIWIYVSVSGVMVYLFLYHLNAPAPV